MIGKGTRQIQVAPCPRFVSTVLIEKVIGFRIYPIGVAGFVVYLKD